jgi:type IV pilus assembly protein PilA
MKQKQGLTPIELLIVLSILGLLAAIAIPRFAVLRASSAQSEAKLNLIAMFKAVKAFEEEKHRYSTLVHEIGFSPERNNRYAYFVGVGGTIEDRSTAVAKRSPTNTAVGFDSFRYSDRSVFPPALNVLPASICDQGIAGISGETWTGMAQGQIDTDPAFDLWSIATYDRDASNGPLCDQPEPNKAGHPRNELNDLVR